MTLSLFDTIFKLFKSPQSKVNTNTIDQVIDRVNQYYTIPQEDVYAVYVPFISSDPITDTIGDIVGINIAAHDVEDKLYYLESKLIPLGFYCSQKKFKKGFKLFVVDDRNG